MANLWDLWDRRETVTDEGLRFAFDVYAKTVETAKRSSLKMLIFGDKRSPRDKDEAIFALLLAVCSQRESNGEYSDSPAFPRMDASLAGWVESDERKTLRSGIEMEALLSEDPREARTARAALDGFDRVPDRSRVPFITSGLYVTPNANEASLDVWETCIFDPRDRETPELTCAPDRTGNAVKGYRSPEACNDVAVSRIRETAPDRDREAAEKYLARKARMEANRAVMRDLVEKRKADRADRLLCARELAARDMRTEGWIE